MRICGKSLIWRFTLSLLLILLAAAWPASLEADEEHSDQTLLKEVRHALAERNLDTAEEKLQAAAGIDLKSWDTKDAQAYQAELERLQELAQLVGEFWKAVAQGAKSLNATEELVIGETRTAIVEFDGNVLILRVNGKNVRYDRQSLPAKVALTLAERVLKKDDPRNKVFFGAFLLMDGKGSRNLAEKYFQEAQQAGVDVKRLLTELGETPTIVIDVPALTPLMKRALAPTSWSLQTPSGERVAREALGDLASLNDEGRLVVTLPEDADPSQVVAARRYTADFRCRLILDCASAGARFGLFSPSEPGERISVALPSGQIKMELIRQGDELKCQLNGAEAKLELPEGTRARMSGLLGVELQPGQTCTIQWIEIVGR